MVQDKHNLLGVEINTYTECGWCNSPKHSVDLTIPFNVWSQWLYISSKMEGKEWGGIFTVKDGVLTNFKLPKQEVTSAECEFKEELGGNGIVHSHHGMGAFHSHQDDTQSRNLYTYSIVLSDKECVATMKKKLPCGGFGYVIMNICISDIPEIPFDKITEKLIYFSGKGKEPYRFEDDVYPGDEAYSGMVSDQELDVEEQKELDFTQDERGLTPRM